MKTFTVLGIKIDYLSVAEILNFVCGVIENNKKGKISTVNNEFIVEAQKNRKFAETLNNSSLNVPDSTGIVWAIRKIYKQKIKRIPGADLFEYICKMSAQKKYRIFLLGGREGVARAAKENLQKRYRGIHIVGGIDSVKIDPAKADDSLISKINETKPNVLFVALGAPKQELWIEENFGRVQANLFIGIGGTLDFVSGRIKRAPLWIRKIGLEWLFRLFIEPKRIKRIVNAVIVFPYLIFTRDVDKKP